MSYALPPAVASGGQLAPGSRLMIAPPGAGSRVRLVGGSISYEPSGASVVSAILADTIAGEYWYARGMTAGGVTLMPIVIPEPGIWLPVNVGLNLVVTGAAGAVYASLFYFIDSGY